MSTWSALRLVRHRTTSSLVGSGSVGLIKSATTELRDRNAYVALFRTNSVSEFLNMQLKRYLILFPLFCHHTLFSITNVFCAIGILV